jgi:hypothetical protein
LRRFWKKRSLNRQHRDKVDPTMEAVVGKRPRALRVHGLPQSGIWCVPIVQSDAHVLQLFDCKYTNILSFASSDSVFLTFLILVVNGGLS